MSSPRTHKKNLLSLLMIVLVIAGVFGAGQWAGIAHAQGGTAAQLGGQQQPAQITQTQQAAQPVRQATAAPSAPGTQDNPANTTQGNAIGGLDKIFGSTSWFYGLVLALLVIVRGFFVLLVTLSGFLLNVMFEANTKLVPSLEPVAQTGWVVMRDLVNGVFILLVLWIALMIILNIEQYGSKKLLAKVLAVAVLINFSLAIVTAIFALSNQFALAFYNKIAAGARNAKRDVDIASYIINVTQIQTVSKNLLDRDASRRLAAAQEEGARIRAGEGSFTFSNQFRDGMFASIGLHPAEAITSVELTQQCRQTAEQNCRSRGQPLLPANVCVIPELESCKASRASEVDDRFLGKERDAMSSVASGVNYIADYFRAINQASGDWNTVTLQQIFLAGIGIVLLGIVVTTFLYAAVALIMRYFYIIFLTIASPIAFVTMALPLDYGKQQGWDYWWKEFMKWVFFAPAFYFLVYLTLILAQRYNDAFKTAASTGGISIASDPRYMIALVVVMGVLLYASRLAKSTSGKMGEFTVGLAKKVGGFAVGAAVGYASGGAIKLGQTTARAAVKPGTRRERTAQWLASSRVLRPFGGAAIQRAGTRALEEQKKDIEERKKNYASLPKDTALAEYRGSLSGTVPFTGANAAAMLSHFADKGWIKDLEPLERERALVIARRYNVEQDVLKADPRLATQQMLNAKGKSEIDNYVAAPGVSADDKPIQYVSENLLGNEIDEKLDVGSLVGDDPKSQAARAGLLANSNLTSSRIEKIFNKNFQAAQKLVEDTAQFLNGYNTQLTALDAQIAAAGVGTAREAALTRQKGNLVRQHARADGIQQYITSTPGGRALGIMPASWAPPAPTTPPPPPLTFSGNRIITGEGKLSN